MLYIKILTVALALTAVHANAATTCRITADVTNEGRFDQNIGEFKLMDLGGGAAHGELSAPTFDGGYMHNAKKTANIFVIVDQLKDGSYQVQMIGQKPNSKTSKQENSSTVLKVQALPIDVTLRMGSPVTFAQEQMGSTRLECK